MDEEIQLIVTDSEREPRLPRNVPDILITDSGAQREEINKNMIEATETNPNSESDPCLEKINRNLFKAAGSGDHEGVSRALREGAEINYRNNNVDCQSDNGLHSGAYGGHDNAGGIFLKTDINVNFKVGADSKKTDLQVPSLQVPNGTDLNKNELPWIDCLDVCRL